MDYHGLAKGLLKEAKKGIQFARMTTPVKMLLCIGLFPLFVLAFVSIASYYLTLFLFKALLAPVEYLHRLVKKEGEDVMHASQFAIYWISWPIVFTLYVLQSIMAITFYFQWFMMMIFVYLATLGGVRWQPIMNDATYDTVQEYSVKPGDIGLLVYTGFLMFFDACLAAAILILIVATNSYDSHMGYEAYQAYANSLSFANSLLPFAISGISVMLFVVNPLVFKKKAELPAEETPLVEEETQAA